MAYLQTGDKSFSDDQTLGSFQKSLLTKLEFCHSSQGTDFYILIDSHNRFVKKPNRYEVWRSKIHYKTPQKETGMLTKIGQFSERVFRSKTSFTNDWLDRF